MNSELKRRVTEWVNEVFKLQNFDIIDIQFPNYDNRGGSVAEIVFSDVIVKRDNHNETLSLFIKKSKDSSAVQETLSLKQSYINEVNVFSKFVPYLQKFAKHRNSSCLKNMPHCYGTIQKDNSYVVILENLKPKEFEVNDLVKPQDLNHAKLVLEAYAKWHAMWFAVKDQEPKIFEEYGRLNSGFIGKKIFEILVASVRKELDFIIEIYKEKNKAEVTAKLEKLTEEFEQIFTDCFTSKDEEYAVIIHGDSWNNNFLFHYDEDGTPDQVVIIDWQGGILVSPLADVVQYLFFCCSGTELECIDDLLQHYHNTLSKTLRELGSDPDKCFPFNACLKSFRRYAPIGVAILPTAAKMSCKNDTGEAYDISTAVQDGDFSGLFGDGLKDPEGYFNRIDGMIGLCIERGFI